MNHENRARDASKRFIQRNASLQLRNTFFFFLSFVFSFFASGTSHITYLRHLPIPAASPRPASHRQNRRKVLPSKPHQGSHPACMSQAASTKTSSAAKVASSGLPANPPFHRAVEDIELDDGLDDHELSGDSESELPASPAAEKNMGSALYRKDGDNSSSSSSTKKMSEVANAISSCMALSFFSVSMILANKVGVAPSVRSFSLRFGVCGVLCAVIVLVLCLCGERERHREEAAVSRTDCDDNSSQRDTTDSCFSR